MSKTRLAEVRRRAARDDSPISPAPIPAPTLHEAEADYLDCLARFGLNSAEAHAAQCVWHALRNRAQASRSAA
ncbi:hypothetical protein [Pelagibius sp.]|uniref:hypothetical protein n=1 Tax=Pelagibius sp. TaxID=1931238 RepID=UPI00260C485F|nr:hypothetical protein [Pelagibius sp.]